MLRSNIRYAIQTRMWGNDRLEQNFEPIFNEVLRAGYEGVECRYSVIWQKDRLSAYLTDHPLKLVALHLILDEFPPGDAKSVTVIRELAASMKALGVPFLLVSLFSKPTQADYTLWLDTYARYAEHFLSEGIQVCYHAHDWEFVHGDWFFAELKNRQIPDLAADIAWIHRAGYGLDRFLSRYGEVIRYVHIKDWHGDEWKELGQGELNLENDLSLLDRLELPWWTVEQDETRRAPLDSAVISMNYLRGRMP